MRRRRPSARSRSSLRTRVRPTSRRLSRSRSPLTSRPVLGLIYDVHGNLEALEAVLADAGEAGVGRFVLGGDYALFGLRPAETVERLRSLDAQWIRGNVDRWTAHQHEAPDDAVLHGAIVDCREALGDRVVADLGELPEWHSDEGRVRFTHGSPASDIRSFGPEPSEEDEELLA